MSADIYCNSPATDNNSKLVSHACQFCRKRKIKCDRLAGGCTHCKRIGSECTYPASQRKGRPRHGPGATGKTSIFAVTSREARLLARIKELEGMLSSSTTTTTNGINSNDNNSADEASPCSDDSKHVDFKPDALNTISQGMGDLGVIDKKVNYTDEAFWANLGVQIRDDDDASDSEAESDDYEDLSTGTPLSAYCPSQSFISNNPLRQELLPLHPAPQMIAYLWEVYVKNVEPILGILHKPTVGRMLLKAQSDPSALTAGDEVLLFAVYFSGLRTLAAEDIQLKFGADKALLLEQFRTGIERGLVKADYMKPKGIASLQALTLYIVCLRFVDAPSMVWGLVGLALRIAQCMGLHRDGTHSKTLTPFEIEMRRRLWHQICLIDIRAAETLGFPPSAIETDTRVPLNIDDNDICLESVRFPESRTGMTEMTLAIMRIKYGIAYRRLISTRPALTLSGRVKMVEDYERTVYREFLDSCEDCEFLRNIADTAIKALMWLGVYREARALSKADRDHLFATAIQVIEMTHELHKDSGCRQWSWLFTSLIQYHAMAFTLSELCVRPSGDDTDRAWRALDESIRPWADAEEGQKYLFQNVIRKLYSKAQKRRRMQKEGQPFVSYDTPPERNLMSGPPLTTLPPTFPPQSTLCCSVPPMAEAPQMLLPFQQSTLEPEFVSLPEAVNAMRTEAIPLPYPGQPLPGAVEMQGIPHNWAVWNDVYRHNHMNPSGEIYGDQPGWYQP